MSNLKSKTGIKDALSGFSNSLIWLIVISIIVARGVIKTDLESIWLIILSVFLVKKLRYCLFYSFL
ncbi:anion permease [Campylobacter jejuni]|nr:anion permease [Campylobacter jejuni]EIE0706716.1 anion permease [Campylobacter jejuni]EIJ1833786.1 anion permease [Campylobacter jejuni]EIL2994898.1 anion permease [Campylobacter jejuni]EIN8813128.1 anion permease [Campylobacter jejuni]